MPHQRTSIAVTAVLALACGVKPPSDGEIASPSVAVARFTAAAESAPDVGSARLEIQAAGKVAFPDGRLAVSDAFINDAPVIASRLPPGEATVELLVATSRTDQRVAAARVVVGRDPIAGWRRIGAIPIDSGTGAFFDPRIFSAHTPADVEPFNDRLLAVLKRSATQPYASGAMTWQNRTLVAFSTGFGDGTYPVYVGSSTTGHPMAVVVDCELLPWRN